MMPVCQMLTMHSIGMHLTMKINHPSTLFDRPDKQMQQSSQGVSVKSDSMPS